MLVWQRSVFSAGSSHKNIKDQNALTSSYWRKQDGTNDRCCLNNEPNFPFSALNNNRQSVVLREHLVCRCIMWLWLTQPECEQFAGTHASAEQSDQRRIIESEQVIPGDSLVTQPRLRPRGRNAESLEKGSREWHRSPGVVHNVLHDLVQDLLEQSRPHPDVFDGLGGERLRRPDGGGRALPPQGLVAHALASPAGHKGHHPVHHHSWGGTSLQNCRPPLCPCLSDRSGK